MNNLRKTTFIVGFSVVITVTTGFSEDRETEASGLSVRVFNYAEVPAEMQNLAQKVATRVFHRAGIAIGWLDCSLSSQGMHHVPDCEQPIEPWTLALRLVPVSPASVAHFGDKTLGIAAQPEPGTAASASVFYDRVEKLARGGAATAAVILGHAMAHELGHLLLGSNSHSPLGLMREQWSRRDLQLASVGEFNFSQTQAAMLREQARQRVGNRSRNNN